MSRVQRFPRFPCLALFLAADLQDHLPVQTQCTKHMITLLSSKESANKHVHYLWTAETGLWYMQCPEG